jgi:hypothetical protein
MKDHDEFVSYIQSLFREAYRYAEPYLRRKDEIQRAFDGEIDSSVWSTLSEMYIPYLRTAVNQAVPFVVNYLFPNSTFFELMPEDENVPFQSVQNVEKVLENQLIYNMKIKQDMIPVIQDAVKFGCGYCEVESYMATQPARELVRFFEDGEVVDERPRMTLSSPVEQLRLRWIPFETVIPTPDGDSMDDPTVVFHLDTIGETEFLAMYEEDSTHDDDDRILMGDPNEIIERTRKGMFDGGMFPIWWIMSQMTGDNDEISRLKKYDQIRKLAEEYRNHVAPVRIPILKCYFKDEHVWLANGETVIYHIKGGNQTLARPIIKADAARDGGNWYAESDVSASKDISDGAITFKNAMMDLLTYHLHPVTVYDELAMATPNKAPDIRPYEKIALRGKVGDSISYLRPPELGQGLISLGQELERELAQSNGQPLNLGGQGTAGLMRGGGGAFESLMQSAMIREEFLGALLEMGLMEPVITHTLMRMQMMNRESFSFMSKGDKEYVKVTATMSEIRHSYGVHVNLSAKMRGGVNEESMAIARYLQVYKNNIYIDQVAALETVNPDRDQARRLLATPEQVEENIKRQQAMAEQQQGMGQTRGEQAVMGGASQRSGRG